MIQKLPGTIWFVECVPGLLESDLRDMYAAQVMKIEYFNS